MTVKATAATTRGRVLTMSALVPLTVALVALWQVGAHVDVWYHVHAAFEIESFFTWPHALLYAGWGLTSLVVALSLGESIGLGQPRRGWLPAGLPLVLLGSVVFGLGGGFDLVWHTLVGFEANQEALLAPSHTWLAVGFGLAAFGALRASVDWWRRAGPSDGRLRPSDLPVIVCLGMLMRLVLWFAIYATPLSADFASGGVIGRGLQGYAGIAWTGLDGQIAGTMGMFIQSIVVALFLVLALRALRLPSGAITILMLHEALLIALATDQWRYLPAVLGAALVGEAIWAGMRRGGLGGPAAERGYWLLGLAVPAVQAALYLALVGVLGGGVIWTAHLWVGVPAVCGLLGLAASMLAVPPRFLRVAAADD